MWKNWNYRYYRSGKPIFLIKKKERKKKHFFYSHNNILPSFNFLFLVTNSRFINEKCEIATRLKKKKKKKGKTHLSARQKEERQRITNLFSILYNSLHKIRFSRKWKYCERERRLQTCRQAKMCVIKNLYNGRPLDFGAVSLTFLPFRACTLLFPSNCPGQRRDHRLRWSSLFKNLPKIFQGSFDF